MKYTTEKAMLEILRRSDLIFVRQKRSICQVLSVVCAVLFVLLTAVIAVMPEQNTLNKKESVYGAFLLSSEAGGYVLTAVIAFSLGISVTMLCVNLSKTQKQMRDNNQSSKEDLL